MNDYLIITTYGARHTSPQVRKNYFGLYDEATTCAKVPLHLYFHHNNVAFPSFLFSHEAVNFLSVSALLLGPCLKSSTSWALQKTPGESHQYPSWTPLNI